MSNRPNIAPLSEGALTIDFGNEISVELNDRAISLAGSFNSDPFTGLLEAVPAYSSVTIFYDPIKVCAQRPRVTAYQSVCDIAVSRLDQLGAAGAGSRRVVEIPVDFGDEAALDISSIVSRSGLGRDEIVGIFVSRPYRVFMVGFLPGFPYMGELDERIASPRRSTPRVKVPRGSVGIAGRQTGIYPFESPGGWQIIGRTDTEMFTPDAETPAFLKPGDEVRFVRS